MRQCPACLDLRGQRRPCQGQHSGCQDLQGGFGTCSVQDWASMMLEEEEAFLGRGGEVDRILNNEKNREQIIVIRIVISIP